MNREQFIDELFDVELQDQLLWEDLGSLAQAVARAHALELVNKTSRARKGKRLHLARVAENPKEDRQYKCTKRLSEDPRHIEFAQRMSPTLRSKGAYGFPRTWSAAKDHRASMPLQRRKKGPIFGPSEPPNYDPHVLRTLFRPDFRSDLQLQAKRHLEEDVDIILDLAAPG